MMNLETPYRILILGSPGSGKTTFAKELSKILELPYISLDDEYWLAGWERPDLLTWKGKLTKIVAQPKWIIDGNHLQTLDIRAQNAQVAFIIKQNSLICVLRILLRIFKIKSGYYHLAPRNICQQFQQGKKQPANKDLPDLIKLAICYKFKTLPTVEQKLQAYNVPTVHCSARTLLSFFTKS